MADRSARERILDVAEELFAESGLDGVSLRAINAAAGLSPAALHYHFGTKDALVEAILLRRMPTLMERRQELLDAIEREEDAPTSHQVVDALVRPLLELILDRGDDGIRYVRFIARAWGDQRIQTSFVQNHFAGGIDRIGPMAERALPDLPSELVLVRLGFALETGLRSLADMMAPTTAPALGDSALSTEERGAALIDFITGGLDAPNSLPMGSLRPKDEVGQRPQPKDKGARQ